MVFIALRTVFAGIFLLLAWLMLAMPAVGMALAVRPLPAASLVGAMPSLSGSDEQTMQRSHDASLRIGRCHREMVGSILHVHLEGAPAELGYYQGVLVGDRIARIETDMMGMFLERVPGFAARHVLLGLVNWNNRNLDGYFLPEEIAEIAGITEAHWQFHDPYVSMSPSYSRGLQYHALHDISQYLIDNPLVHPPQIGCSAVVARDTATSDGHILVGRLFDFEGGACFDRDKVVYSVRPDGGIPFVSVAWGGMAGAVTGLNDAGLWVSINAAASDGQRFVGRPIVMIVRQILMHCRTIDEAITIIRSTDVFVSDAILLASSADDRVVVVEKGPHACGVFVMTGDRLALTNHFRSEVWASDQANAARIAGGTTSARLARLESLLNRKESHDLTSILEILRDRRGAGGTDVGFGNRSTINAWIGAHLVVADVHAKRMYVCESYHGLGPALAFGIDGPVDCPPLPASADLDIFNERCDRYRELETRTIGLLRAGKRVQAAQLAQELLALNPDYFNANALAGACSDDPLRRKELLERALSLQPAYPADADGIRLLLKQP